MPGFRLESRTRKHTKRKWVSEHLPSKSATRALPRQRYCYTVTDLSTANLSMPFCPCSPMPQPQFAPLWVWVPAEVTQLSICLWVVAENRRLKLPCNCNQEKKKKKKLLGLLLVSKGIIGDLKNQGLAGRKSNLENKTLIALFLCVEGRAVSLEAAFLRGVGSPIHIWLTATVGHARTVCTSRVEVSPTHLAYCIKDSLDSANKWEGTECLSDHWSLFALLIQDHTSCCFFLNKVHIPMYFMCPDMLFLLNMLNGCHSATGSDLPWRPSRHFCSLKRKNLTRSSGFQSSFYSGASAVFLEMRENCIIY